MLVSWRGAFQRARRGERTPTQYARAAARDEGSLHRGRLELPEPRSAVAVSAQASASAVERARATVRGADRVAALGGVRARHARAGVAAHRRDAVRVGRAGVRAGHQRALRGGGRGRGRDHDRLFGPACAAARPSGLLRVRRARSATSCEERRGSCGRVATPGGWGGATSMREGEVRMGAPWPAYLTRRARRPTWGAFWYSRAPRERPRAARPQERSSCDAPRDAARVAAGLPRADAARLDSRRTRADQTRTERGARCRPPALAASRPSAWRDSDRRGHASHRPPGDQGGPAATRFGGSCGDGPSPCWPRSDRSVRASTEPTSAPHR